MRAWGFLLIFVSLGARAEPSCPEQLVAPEVHDVVIIGGGPAGLALGYYLQKSDLTFTILEAGPHPGHSWQNMPEGLTLITPWEANRLPGFDLHGMPAAAHASGREYGRYLQSYAHHFHLPVRPNTQVRTVTHNGRNFEIPGAAQGRLLVNATGYFFNPFVPEIAGASDSAIPQVHAGAVTPEILANKSRVLIVGKRISAGQLLTQLRRRGIGVALSIRSPLSRNLPESVEKTLVQNVLFWDQVLLATGLSRFFPQQPMMQAGEPRRRIQRGEVALFPDIDWLEDDRVVFSNGARERFDLIIYATGYRPHLSHLEDLIGSDLPDVRRMESTAMRGLFFLGLQNLRDFRSRFLRGIRADASVLARILAERE